MRILSLICSSSVLVLAATLSACATPQGTDDAEIEPEEFATRGPPQCSQQDIGAFNVRIRTCVQDFGPTTLPEEMQMRHPYVVTVIDTPRGKFSNPLIWSLEVERDGELVVDRRFSEEGSDVQTEEVGERVEIRSAVPLNAEGELEPGTYEIRYRTAEGDEVGTTIITVESEDEENTPEEQAE